MRFQEFYLFRLKQYFPRLHSMVNQAVFLILCFKTHLFRCRFRCCFSCRNLKMFNIKLIISFYKYMQAQVLILTSSFTCPFVCTCLQNIFIILSRKQLHNGFWISLMLPCENHGKGTERPHQIAMNISLTQSLLGFLNGKRKELMQMMSK